jgi:uncharacterized protein YqjF (DUF2071 family)
VKTGLELDRLAMRARPAGSPVMQQNWEKLLFLHWPVDAGVVRPLVPAQLDLDLYDDRAWIGITPFALTGLRLLSLPPVPGLDSFLELNVRTYVHYKGMPGIWFFSLDASKLIPALAARAMFSLPYFKANMDFREYETEFRFQSTREDSPAADFRAHWKTGVRLREPHIDSLAFFLVERYGFFSVSADAVSLTRVYHHPWILEEAFVESWRSTMIPALGMPQPDSAPLAHFSRFMNVEVWPPTGV